MNGFRAHSKVQSQPNGFEALETHSSAVEWCPLCLGRLEWGRMGPNGSEWARVGPPKMMFLSLRLKYNHYQRECNS